MDSVESFLGIRTIKPGARVMMMTAHSVEHLLQQAVDNGAVGLLRKPFDLTELLEAIEAIMTKAR